MTAYTVLVRLPDYLTDDGETFLAHVEAEDPQRAGAAAREAAKCANDDEDAGTADDYLVLIAFEGHHQDVKDRLSDHGEDDDGEPRP